MDWKKIMNRTAKFQEDSAVCEEVQQYLAQLVPQLNFRLLMETDLSSRSFLWVEAVTVTEYQSAPAADACASGTESLPGRIWNRLMGMLGRARSLKKYKKERR